jgi:hypothetical protein
MRVFQKVPESSLQAKRSNDGEKGLLAHPHFYACHPVHPFSPPEIGCLSGLGCCRAVLRLLISGTGSIFDGKF